MNPGDSEQRLMQLLKQQRDEECRRLRERAENEARDLIRNAYKRARRHLHQAAEAERSRARSRIATARAEFNTLRRRHRQQLGSVILKTAKERLPERLAECWSEADVRAAWIGAAVGHALERLPKGRWRVRHAFCFNAEDNNTLLKAMGERMQEQPELIVVPEMDAGLIIECGGVTLDASVSGLLADRALVEARLLALVTMEKSP